MSPDKQPMSVAELVELPTDSWVNDGFTAVVQNVERKQYKDKRTQAMKAMFICSLRDTTGSATVELCMFTAPKFGEGDQVDFLGQGIKFKNEQYGPKVSIGDKTEVHVVGKSVHHAEQQQRAATGAPAIDGTPQMVPGQTVGMAIKEALAITVMAWGGIEGLAKLKDPLFWADVKTNASNIIRISRSLEHGKLSPAPWQTAAPEPQKAAPPPQPPQNPPSRFAPKNEREDANLSDENLGEDVPF